jgi:phosphomevalonate kinase
MISTTAPGKAVLSGEYVVLDNAPAIVMAVDRRVRVSVAESADECHAVSAPGYLDGNWYFRLDRAGEFEWQQALPGPLAFSLVEEIWKSFDTAQWPSLALVVDTQELCNAPTGLKLGLGSSAAVSVALTAALQQFAAGHGDAGTIAMEAHHRFQGGRGSGVDVAASLHGGVILYRRAGSEARQLGWPAGLCYRFLWSGQVTSTAGKLEKLIERRGQLAASDSKTMLENLAEDVAAAWSLGDGRQILEAIPAYVDALRQFSVDQDLGIFDAGHEELARRASDNGIVYKPCGAGGGDIGIVLAACEHDVEEFCEQARQQNFHVLDIALDSQGVLFAESSH